MYKCGPGKGTKAAQGKATSRPGNGYDPPRKCTKAAQEKVAVPEMLLKAIGGNVCIKSAQVKVKCRPGNGYNSPRKCTKAAQEKLAAQEMLVERWEEM